MQPIKKLDQLIKSLEGKSPKKIAVTFAQDPNTIGAISKAVDLGFAQAIMIGDKEIIIKECKKLDVDYQKFEIIDEKNDVKAAALSVEMVRNGDADVLMKGLIGTDKFLKAVLNKEKGLLPPKAVMSYVCALDIPKYDKLLFITDTAVIPFPDLKQKIAMTKYAVNMAHKFGIENPKVALVSCTEKVNPAIQNTVNDAIICKMNQRGQIKNCVIDGPLDIFLACDKEAVKIKGVQTPINGEADVLVFPTLEACNTFYKGLMLFGGGELAGLIQGTIKPVVVMSRSESEKSKLYCIALSCLMAED